MAKKKLPPNWLQVVIPVCLPDGTGSMVWYYAVFVECKSIGELVETPAYTQKLYAKNAEAWIGHPAVTDVVFNSVDEEPTDSREKWVFRNLDWLGVPVIEIKNDGTIQKIIRP
jgi:hypothetical protein